MALYRLGDCEDCIDGQCTMNCSSAVLVTGSEHIAASIWSGVFPQKASAQQVREWQARPSMRELEDI